MQQALWSSDIATSLIAKIGSQLRSAFLKGLQDVSNKEWVRATTPLKLGGMVLRYPEVAGLMKAAEFALDLGADTQCVQEERTEHVKIPSGRLAPLSLRFHCPARNCRGRAGKV